MHTSIRRSIQHHIGNFGQFVRTRKFHGHFRLSSYLDFQGFDRSKFHSQSLRGIPGFLDSNYCGHHCTTDPDASIQSCLLKLDGPRTS